MLSTPMIETRKQRHYMAIRSEVAMKDIPSLLPPLIPEVEAWLTKNYITPDGPLFFQYLRMFNDGRMLTEVGFPVNEPATGDGRVLAGFFPAGEYAVLTYTGDYKNMPSAHMALDKWVKENGYQEKHKKTPEGMEWGTRTELYLTDPSQEPDPEKWVTEVSFLLEG